MIEKARMDMFAVYFERLSRSDLNCYTKIRSPHCTAFVITAYVSAGRYHSHCSCLTDCVQ